MILCGRAVRTQCGGTAGCIWNTLRDAPCFCPIYPNSLNFADKSSFFLCREREKYATIMAKPIPQKENRDGKIACKL
jgi:hypothetical protein